MIDFYIKNLKEDAIKRAKHFYTNCGISVIRLKQKLQFFLGLSAYIEFSKELKKLISSKHKNYRIFYYKDSNLLLRGDGFLVPSISMEEYIRNISPGLVPYLGEIFNDDDYLIFILEFKTTDTEEKNDILTKFSNNIVSLLNKYGLLQNQLANFEPELVCHLVGIASWTYVGYSYYVEEKKRKNNKETSLESNLKESTDACLVDFKKSYTIKEFISKIKNLENAARSSLKFSCAFQYENNEGMKTLREELLPIYYYLIKIANIDSKNSLFKQDTIINLELKDDPFDAKIGNIIIEVTLALDQKEYLIRRHLCSLHGNTNMPLDFRTYNQLLIDSFPLPVIDAIKRKCNGKYQDENKRILIIQTLYEFADNNKLLVETWIDYIKNNLSPNNYIQIVLLVDDIPFFIKSSNNDIKITT